MLYYRTMTNVARRFKQVAGLFGLEDQDNAVPFDPKARTSALGFPSPSLRDISPLG